QAEDGIRDRNVTGVQTCAHPIFDLATSPVPGQPAPMPMSMPDGSTATSMPQDVRAAPDGHHFYVADMLEGGVFVVDGDAFTVTKIGRASCREREWVEGV